MWEALVDLAQRARSGVQESRRDSTRDSRTSRSGQRDLPGRVKDDPGSRVPGTRASSRNGRSRRARTPWPSARHGSRSKRRACRSMRATRWRCSSSRIGRRAHWAPSSPSLDERGRLGALPCLMSCASTFSSKPSATTTPSRSTSRLRVQRRRCRRRIPAAAHRSSTSAAGKARMTWSGNTAVSWRRNPMSCTGTPALASHYVGLARHDDALGVWRLFESANANRPQAVMSPPASR